MLLEKENRYTRNGLLKPCAAPTSMHMSQMIHQLENADSVAQVDEYPLDIFDETASVEEAKKRGSSIHSRGRTTLGNMQCTIWETAWYLRGMENLMTDMMTEEPIGKALFEKVTAMSLNKAVIFAKAGVVILFVGDDIEMQQSIMMSKQLYND